VSDLERKEVSEILQGRRDSNQVLRLTITKESIGHYVLDEVLDAIRP
jgi:hypothetical protein